MSAFTALPRRSVRRPVRPGAAHFAMDFWAPVAPAPRVAERPVLSLVPAPAPVVAPAARPVEVPAPAAPVSTVAREVGSAFRVEVLVPGPDGGWGFPVRESLVSVAPSARAARVEAADDFARPVAVWALVGGSETLVWGVAA